MTPEGFAASEREFQSLRNTVDASVDLSVRLPEWPFRESRGQATIFEWDVVLSGKFGTVLDALVRAYGDSTVTVIALEPDMPYYPEEYGIYPAFQIASQDVLRGYGDAVWAQPDGDLTAVLVDAVKVLAMTGSSGRWALLGQRDWEIGLLVAPDREGGWRSEVPWFDIDVDLDDIRSPAGWGMPLTIEDRTKFAEVLERYGCGPKG